MNIWHDINPDRISADKFIACIEISKGSKNKYELDKETGRLILDRVLYTSTHYPANYGFIPLTYADDNDPLDVLVLSNEEIVPLALVNCYPIGMVSMSDCGFQDDKIIAIPLTEPNWRTFQDINQLPPHIMDEICHFFTVYKELEGKHTAVIKIVGKEEAVATIQKAIDEYLLRADELKYTKKTK
ncbi:MAG: inorganic diphosphatase [Christensenellales bacterium]|jgi:inorganic pyrophosphatase